MAPSGSATPAGSEASQSLLLGVPGPARCGPDSPGHRTRRVRSWPGRRTRTGPLQRPLGQVPSVARSPRRALEGASRSRSASQRAETGLTSSARGRSWVTRSRRTSAPLSPRTPRRGQAPRLAVASVALADVDDVERLVGHLDTRRQAGGVGNELAQLGEVVVQAQPPGLAHRELGTGTLAGQGVRRLAGPELQVGNSGG